MRDFDIQIYLEFIEENLRVAGKIAMKQFGTVFAHKTKADPHQVITEVDLALEEYIIRDIHKNFPTHSIIAEESGLQKKNSTYTWIIDPIDGTSNYAQGIPWFGTMIALLFNKEVIASGIYLPVTSEMVIAGVHMGAFYNGKKYLLPKHAVMNQSLISFCLDGQESTQSAKFISSLYVNLLQKSQNLRCTNSAYDYIYAAVGKLGATITLTNKIWDIVPISLIAKETGCKVSDIDGNELSLDLTKEGIFRNYSLLIAHPLLYQPLQMLIHQAQE